MSIEVTCGHCDKQYGLNVPLDTAYIFEVGRSPSGFIKYVGLMLLGLVILLAGLFWILFVHE